MFDHPGYWFAGAVLILILLALFTGHDPPNGN